MIYRVQQSPEKMSLDANWAKQAWQAVPAIELTHFMGERPTHFPQAQAKVLYDADAVYVTFRVEDRYVRAVTRSHQGEVWRDSCVEFFFSPTGDTSDGYFNLEMNCGGTMLFHFQPRPWEDRQEVSPADLEQIRVAHVLPKIVEPEWPEPTVWSVEYRLPCESSPTTSSPS